MRRVAIVLGLSLFASPAMAQDAAAGHTASLGWARLAGAESCPTAQALAQATEDILGRDAFVSAADASLAIEGRAEPREGGFRATLVVTDTSGASVGERVVEVDGACDALLAPLSIALAILVDPDATPITPPPPPPPETVVETRIVHDRVEVPVEVPTPRWRLVLDLGGVFALGATPFASGGGELFVFLTPPGFVPIGLHGWLVPFSRADYVRSGMARSVDQLTSWAGLTICPLDVHEDAFDFDACAGLDVGAVFVLAGSSTERERITGGLDLSVRGRIHAIGPVWITLSAALLVPFRAQTFDDPVTVPYYAPEPVALIVTLGPTFAFTL